MLQVGREAMDERLAVIASSKEDLIDRLREYSKGKTDVQNIWTGNEKISRSISQPAMDEGADEEFIRNIINDKELPKLAQLWVSGVDIDWSLLHPTEIPRRLN